MTTFDLWIHEQLGPFAVRIQFGQVTGVCGPLPLSTAADCDPSGFDYDAREEMLSRFRDSPEQFCRLEPWWGGQRVTPMLGRSQPRWLARVRTLGLLVGALPLALGAAALDDGLTGGSEEDLP
jgi:hypothetical protein